MSDRTEIWQGARELCLAGTVGAMATISRHRGSLPMAHDAKMLVTAEGRRWGTVGGGCVEADVTEQALTAARDCSPTFVRHTLNADVAGDIGLSCGGTVELFLEPLVASDSMAHLYGAVAEAVIGRKPAAVVTGIDWSSGPRKLALIGSDEVTVGGGLAAPAPAIRGESRRTAYVDQDAGTFVEHIDRLPRVIVFGAGHVGAEIARVAAAVGFYVSVIDDRAEFANADRIPWAHEIVVEDFRSVLARWQFDEDDHVLATTRGHSFDAYIVEKTAASPARYVGMLGSTRKRMIIWDALETAGVAREALERVRSPIGESIGADTPAEIAVAVVAELIKIRRLGA